MARNKKNKNSQTFDVYPYLDQYQYLMRDGGALPWYQTKGPVRGGDAAGKPVRPNANDDAYRGKSREFMKALNKYYTDLAVWEEANNIPEDQREKDNVNRKEKVVEEVNTKTIEDYLNEGFSQVEAQKMFESQATTGNDEPLSIRAQGIQDYKDKKISKEQLDEILKTNPGEEEVVEEEVVEETVVDGSGSGEGYELDEVIEESVKKSTYDQAVQDYQDGKISRRELDELTQRYSIDSKRTTGYKGGDTQFESLPGSPLHLLGNALNSTAKTINNFGKARINPKTGKPYEKADFKKTSVNWDKISNENEANILYSPDKLKEFVGGNKDLNVSDVFGSNTTVEAQSFNKFQDDRTQMDIDAGIDPLYSGQTMSKYDGTTSYDDVTVDVEKESSNPEYDEMVKILKTRGEDITVEDDLKGQQDKLLADYRIKNNIPEGNMSQEQMDKFFEYEEKHEYTTKVNPELENIPKTITETESVTRAHTDADLTSGDIAENNLKDMSLKNLTFDKDGNVTKYEGFGGTGSGEGSMGIWDYDPDKQYGDYEETVIINNQKGKQNRKEGLNSDGTTIETEVDETEGGPKERSRVTNEDFSVTITYDDGSTKTMNESSQAKKQRELKGGKMGLEMFVYGGQPPKEKLSFTDIYAKGGDVLKWYLDEGEVDETENESTDELIETVVEPDPDINFTEEEINTMDETLIEDSEIVESTYGDGMQGLKNVVGAATKTGLAGRVGNTYANLGQAGADWADFGNAMFKGWDNMAKEAESEQEGNLASDMFTVQESSQGIHDPNSGDAWTNKKVDEIYAGNVMKGPKIMQVGGPPAQQAPVEEALDYAALSQFSDNNAWDSEVSYSPEVIAYQKRIMGKMRDGGSLPSYQKKGEKVNQLLEYIPDFPRTGGAEFGPGGFNAEQYQNAITRDSTLLNNYIEENPWRSYFAGSNQDHASSAGSWSGDIQLNREWKHKLLMQDDQEAAAQLNFYKRGGQLPRFQDNGETSWWDKAKNKVSDVWENTDFATPINKGLDKIQTAGTVGGLFPAAGNIVDLANAGVSSLRAGYSGYTGDTEGVKKHTENVATNLLSAIPGVGQAVGGASLVKDAAGYAGVIDSDKSVTTQVTDATTKPSVQIAENTKGVKIDKVARDGGEQEVEVDYETLQELIKAGADIEII